MLLTNILTNAILQVQKQRQKQNDQKEGILWNLYSGYATLTVFYTPTVTADKKRKY